MPTFRPARGYPFPGHSDILYACRASHRREATSFTGPGLRYRGPVPKSFGSEEGHCRSSKALRPELEQAGQRSMDLRDSAWFQDTSASCPTLVHQASPPKGDYSCSRWRTSQAPAKRHHCASRPVNGGFLLPGVHHSEEERGPASHLQPKRPKLFCPPCPLQDGKHQSAPGPPASPGLDGESRFEGRLLHSAHTQGVAGLTSPVVGGQAFQVHLSTFRPVLCSENFHKTAQASSSFPQDTGCAPHSLHRRYVVASGDQGNGQPTDAPSLGSTGSSRILCELQQIGLGACPGDRIPGISGQFRVDVNCPSSTEGSWHCQRGKQHSNSHGSECSSPSKAGGPVQFMHPCSSPSPLTLSKPAEPQEQGSGTGRLQPEDHPLPAGQTGAGVVGRVPGEPQRESSEEPPARPNPLLGRINAGLGSDIPGHLNRRGLDAGREELSHKCAGALGGVVCNSGFLPAEEGPDSPSLDGQCQRCDLYQSHGGNKVISSVPTGNPPLDVGPGPGNLPESQTCSRCRQWVSRSDVKEDSVRSNRLATEPDSVWQVAEAMGPF